MALNLPRLLMCLPRDRWLQSDMRNWRKDNLDPLSNGLCHNTMVTFLRNQNKNSNLYFAGRQTLPEIMDCFSIRCLHRLADSCHKNPACGYVQTLFLRSVCASAHTDQSSSCYLKSTTYNFSSDPFQKVWLVCTDHFCITTKYGSCMTRPIFEAIILLLHYKHWWNTRYHDTLYLVNVFYPELSILSRTHYIYLLRSMIWMVEDATSAYADQSVQ